MGSATALAGYFRVLAHGMLMMGMTGRMLTDCVGHDRLSRFRERFVSQVRPGDRLTVRTLVTGARDGVAELPVSTVNGDGADVFSRYATARVGG